MFYYTNFKLASIHIPAAKASKVIDNKAACAGILSPTGRQAEDINPLSAGIIPSTPALSFSQLMTSAKALAAAVLVLASLNLLYSKSHISR